MSGGVGAYGGPRIFLFFDGIFALDDSAGNVRGVISKIVAQVLAMVVGQAEGVLAER